MKLSVLCDFSAYHVIKGEDEHDIYKGEKNLILELDEKQLNKFNTADGILGKSRVLQSILHGPTGDQVLNSSEFVKEGRLVRKTLKVLKFEEYEEKAAPKTKPKKKEIDLEAK